LLSFSVTPCLCGEKPGRASLDWTAEGGWPTQARRVATIELADTIPTEGAPSFAFFAKGGYHGLKKSRVTRGLELGY
jgi:hypothetical protein